MFTMRIYDGEDGMFKWPEDAIKYMYATNFEKEVSVYDICSADAYKKTEEIYKVIKAYNKGKRMEEQILPSLPFGFRGILGCLGVQVYSITLGTYKDNHECIALFTGYNKSVLDDSKEMPHVVPGLKAVSSLALLGSLMSQE